MKKSLVVASILMLSAMATAQVAATVKTHDTVAALHSAGLIPAKVSLAVTNSAVHYVELDWGASTTPTVTSYKIYRGSTSGGPYSQIGTVASTLLTFNDNVVTNGATYFYVVTAVDPVSGESAFSNEASAVIPLPPSPPTLKTPIVH